MNEASRHIEVYRQEAEELLVEIEATILELEENPDDIESINKLFRAMHTIKGSGAMFGFDDISGFTHHVETTLDMVRNGKIPVTKPLINLILASRDRINEMLDAASKGTEVNQEQNDSIIASLNALQPGKAPDPIQQKKETASEIPVQGAEEESTYRIRFSPHPGLFSSGTEPSLILEELRNLGQATIIAQQNNIPELADLHPESCYLYWDIILTTRKTMNEIKDVFIFVEDNCDLSIDILNDDQMPGEDKEPKKIGEILLERKDVKPEDLHGILSNQKRIGELLVDAKIVDPNLVESALAEQKHLKQVTEKQKQKQAASSIRVPADKLDTLVDLVGEMVTAQARLNQKASELNNSDLTLITEEIERLVAGLRDNTMSLRMLQIGVTFSSFKRLVRDLSAELGKEIILTTDGGETELDKTVIERLNDPLVHIIRNSIDHGIENPEVRKQAGKPAQGTINLSARHTGAHVAIQISDDGAGLDTQVIRAKALEKGLITLDENLTEKEIFQLIFAPGFSTAKSVTDVSGRGVGMDVVKRNVESLRGTIEIESQKGKGTTITLKLPLTLAIIDGLMVNIGDDYFILPLSSVEECVELDKKKADKIKGRNILNVRGEVVPYIRLRDQFEIESEKPELEHIVITEVNGERIGFVVDNVIGGHQTVIKSLGPAFKDIQDVSGATILGDGTVALILDVNKLAH
jgi:two-component system, chemotaxis family, sensor kinase CheA